MDKFRTTGHHTCNDNTPEYLRINAPIYCKDVDAFLGKGYYLWENNIPYAHHWGDVRYKQQGRNYAICEWKIECEWSVFFDLLGRKDHVDHFRRIVELVRSTATNGKKWSIGRIIQYWQRTSTLPENAHLLGAFPYKLIRVNDKNANRKLIKETKFSDNQIGSMDLDPCNILCVIEKKGILLEPMKVIHRSSNQ